MSLSLRLNGIHLEIQFGISCLTTARLCVLPENSHRFKNLLRGMLAFVCGSKYHSPIFSSFSFFRVSKPQVLFFCSLNSLLTAMFAFKCQEIELIIASLVSWCWSLFSAIAPSYYVAPQSINEFTQTTLQTNIGSILLSASPLVFICSTEVIAVYNRFWIAHF